MPEKERARRKRVGLIRYITELLLCRPLQCRRDMKEYEIPLGLRAGDTVNKTLAACHADSELSDSSDNSVCESLLAKAALKKSSRCSSNAKPYKPKIILPYKETHNQPATVATAGDRKRKSRTHKSNTRKMDQSDDDSKTKAISDNTVTVDAVNSPRIESNDVTNDGFEKTIEDASTGFGNSGFANPSFAIPGFANPSFAIPGFANMNSDYMINMDEGNSVELGVIKESGKAAGAGEGWA